MLYFLGIVTSSKLSQSIKANIPSVLILSGISTCFKAVQVEKA
ncbi:MAG: hypothetical protein V8S33_01920 [Intestinibacter bartlettii]